MRRLFVVRPCRNDRFNPALDQLISKRVAVIASICNQPLGLLVRHANRIQRMRDQFHFRRRGRVQVCSQRSTRAIDHHQPLCALAAFGLADFVAPFFAGAKLPSAKHASQRSLSLSSSSISNARHKFKNTSCSSQSRKRRQQVDELPYSFGSADQGAPVHAIHKMPSKHFRSSTGGRPPFLRSVRAGMWMRIFSHCLSVTPSQPIWAVYGF